MLSVPPHISAVSPQRTASLAVFREPFRGIRDHILSPVHARAGIVPSRQCSGGFRVAKVILVVYPRLRRQRARLFTHVPHFVALILLESYRRTIYRVQRVHLAFAPSASIAPRRVRTVYAVALQRVNGMRLQLRRKRRAYPDSESCTSRLRACTPFESCGQYPPKIFRG